jgi:hypothetical protein
MLLDVQRVFYQKRRNAWKAANNRQWLWSGSSETRSCCASVIIKDKNSKPRASKTVLDVLAVNLDSDEVVNASGCGTYHFKRVWSYFERWSCYAERKQRYPSSKKIPRISDRVARTAKLSPLCWLNHWRSSKVEAQKWRIENRERSSG